MKKTIVLLSILSVGLSAHVHAAITLDITDHLPAAMGGTTTLADGTTITLTENSSGAGWTPGTSYPNGVSSDFDYSNPATDPTNGNWHYITLTVMFGSDFGVSGDGLVSADDFNLSQSSLNGSSGWYEFGFLDLLGPASAGVTDSAIEMYLNDASNYDNSADQGVGDSVGALAANDDINNRDASGNQMSGTGASNGNGTWNNTEFGLPSTTGITGFRFYYGAAAADGVGSSPGASIGSITDSMSTQAVPEPSSFLFLALLGLFGSGSQYFKKRRDLAAAK